MLATDTQKTKSLDFISLKVFASAIDSKFVLFDDPKLKLVIAVD